MVFVLKHIIQSLGNGAEISDEELATTISPNVATDADLRLYSEPIRTWCFRFAVTENRMMETHGTKKELQNACQCS